MKRHIYFLLIVTITGCGSPATKQPASLTGAYSMLSQTFGGNALDTTYTQHKQLKIYAGNYMMYVRLSPADSLSAFGIGTYTADTSRLIENIIYSAADTIEINSLYSDTINIAKTAIGFEQAVPKIKSDKGDISLTEEYESVGTAATSPLDGCWKQVSGYSVTGTDTVRWTDVQYKAFYAGNFAIGNVQTARNNITHAGISYGTFVMDGNTVRETITASTWAALNGQSFEVAITFKGPDAFTQTIIQKDGTKEVLFYERMGKKA